MHSGDRWIIQADGLTKRFGTTLAVDKLDLQMGSGEIFGFLGPNGAGKTTTIKMLVGLLRPTAGRATIGGFDIQEQPLQAKRLIGYVSDTPFLYEKLTGREFLRFVARLYDLDAPTATRRIEELLALFDLADRAGDLIQGYSHGMRQKLTMAMEVGGWKMEGGRKCLVHALSGHPAARPFPAKAGPRKQPCACS